MKNADNSTFKPGRILRVITGLLIGGVFGLLIGIFFVSYDIKGLIPSEFSRIGLFGAAGIFVLMYVLAIAIHELAHFIYFKSGGIEMRALILFFFVFIKEKGSWRFRIKPNALTVMGGMAVPDIPSIESEEKFKRGQKTFANAILAGPIVSLLWLILIIAASIPGYLLNVDIYLKSFIFSADISLFIITLFLILTCFVKSELAVGDFPAYRLVKNDDFFCAAQMYQYMAFSSNPDLVRKNSEFLFDKTNRQLDIKFDGRVPDVYTLGIIDYYLLLLLAGEEDVLPAPVMKYVDYFSENPDALLNNRYSEVYKSLLFHITGYLSLNDETKQKAHTLFDLLKAPNRRRTAVDTYFIKQVEQLLGLNDNRGFLNNKKNIRTSSAWELWSLFPKYIEYEYKINNKK